MSVEMGSGDCLARAVGSRPYERPDGRRVLVVDSERPSAALVKGFESAGYAVDWAADLAAAQSYLQAGPDLAVVELQVGSRSGLELLEMVSFSSPRTVVVVLTMYGSIESARWALEHGAADYFTKPAAAGEILSVLGEAGESSTQPVAGRLDVQLMRRRYIEEVLKHAGSLAQASRLLHVERRSLRRMLKRRTESNEIVSDEGNTESLGAFDLANVQTIFCDVDDTIIHGKSLIEFSEHLFRSVPEGEAVQRRARLRELIQRARSESRSVVNRAFYGDVLGGLSVATVTAAAEAWYAQASASPDFFNSPVCQLLSEARNLGLPIVLLSGSFRELIEPISYYVGARDIIAAPLERINGQFTGRLIGEPTVEDGKATALRDYATRAGLDLARCVGVADDVSDLAFLEAVGRCFIPPNAHPVLMRLAETRGWRLLETS